MSSTLPFTTHDPACDRCRTKKIRCDRGRPSCEGCRREQISCKFSARENRVLELPTQEQDQDQDDLTARLVFLENSILDLSRLVTESENRNQLCMLQLEYRLLSRVLAVRSGNDINSQIE
ncbi:hypothetical protein BJ170DRAFT_292382 [Xylariales sp. AK1849]|nr:hypothetical protein BJ170DRAFT_292382 [Xylariales sp. AK1849]